jgi:hypothetical protein
VNAISVILSSDVRAMSASTAPAPNGFRLETFGPSERAHTDDPRARSDHYSFTKINPLLVFAAALLAAMLSVGAIAALAVGIHHLVEQGVLPSSLTVLEGVLRAVPR